MREKHYGELTEGCKLCFKGEKLVLFITGLCPRDCIYCPIAKERKNKDVVYINEIESFSTEELIEEVKRSGARGAGITGGDPLARVDRTLSYIKILKENFGKEFHIHLYTSLELLDIEKLTMLEKEGLDEIRVHPDIFDKTLWHKLDLLRETSMETVIEIPAIPKKEKEILDLIKYARDKVKAFNLNELEYSSNKFEEYKKNRWKQKESYAIIGSESTASKVLKKSRAWHIRIHYCSAKFKDEVQFSGRLKNYAKNVALPCDKITEAGTIFHGAIYLSRENIFSEDEEKKIKQLDEIKKLLEKVKFFFPEDYFFLDEEKYRIVCSVKTIKKVKRIFPNCALVEEYPTRDRIEIYSEFIS